MTAFSSWQPESTPPRALSSRPPLVGTLVRHVLLAVARRPGIRVVDLAASVGLSVRAVQSILADLAANGCVERHHEGRRTVYRVHGNSHFRHPSLMDHEVGELLELFAPQPPAAAP